jgi:GH43 family beta-xylosidase
MAKKQMAILLVLICVVEIASATRILWCSGKSNTDYGWVDLLIEAGYTVDRLDQATVMTQAKVNLANTYDLVIVGRDTISGDYANTGEPALWNSITSSMICQSGYLWANNRWKWMDVSGTFNSAADVNIKLAPDNSIYDILFNGVTPDANGNITLVSNSTTLASTASAGNGIVIGCRDYASEPWVWVAYWPKDVEFYAGSGMYAKGPRMAFAGGESNDNNRGALNLTEAGKRVFLNAVYALSGASFNRKPTVSAGNDRIVSVNQTITLNGSAFDPDSPLTLHWTQISGPGTAVFQDPAVVNPNVTFDMQGVYVLEITATDGTTTAADQVTVTVRTNPNTASYAVLFSDSYNRANNTNIDASFGGMGGSLAPMTYVESYEGSGATSSIRINANQLELAYGAGMSNLYLDHNFTDAAILAAGGFTIVLDVTGISSTSTQPSNRFGGFGVGMTRAEAAAARDIEAGPTTMRGGSTAAAVADFFVDLALDGVVRAWTGNTLLGAANVNAAQGQIRVDFLCSGFNAGQAVIARVYFNGRLLGSVPFAWDHTGQNYVGLSGYATNYVRMDNLAIMPYANIFYEHPDISGNGTVGMADLTQLANQWLSGYTVPCPSADFNADCAVDMTDLAALASYWDDWRSYQNPVIDAGKQLADPTVIYHNGLYYLYATGDVAGGGFRYWTSPDLVNWTRGSVVFSRSNSWAPDVWRDPVSGKFYLYYTARSNSNPDWQVVGVAESDSPTGTFTNSLDLYENAIDAHLFRDDDGSLYLYYVQFPGFKISVQRMSDPRTKSGAPSVVLQPTSAWEKNNGNVTEGPWIIKRNGIYYLIYSGSHAAYPNYAVGYATADNPMGPFTRAIQNPIVQRSQDVYGPGHGCAVQDAFGNWWHVYHQKRYDTDNDFNRYICLDRLWFDQVGNLYGTATRGKRLTAPAGR